MQLWVRVSPLLSRLKVCSTRIVATARVGVCVCVCMNTYICVCMGVCVCKCLCMCVCVSLPAFWLSIAAICYLQSELNWFVATFMDSMNGPSSSWLPHSLSLSLCLFSCRYHPLIQLARAVALMIWLRNHNLFFWPNTCRHPDNNSLSSQPIVASPSPPSLFLLSFPYFSPCAFPFHSSVTVIVRNHLSAHYETISQGNWLRHATCGMRLGLPHYATVGTASSRTHPQNSRTHTHTEEKLL